MKRLMIKKCLEIGEREVPNSFVERYRGVYNMCRLEHLIESEDTLDESLYFCDNVCEVKSICNLALSACLL